MQVYTASGKQLVLQEPPLKQGAEGAVYRIEGHDHRVAKIYLKEADKRKEKIETMVKFRETGQFKHYINTDDIAWPMASLYDARGEFIGFGMNCVKAKDELNDLYVYPPHRVISMRDKIDCLIHLCDLVTNIHLAGQIVGDFNPNNIKVSLQDKAVSIVDVDSFNIKSGSKEHKCIVCMPGVVAPELIKKCRGTTYEACKGETFTKETDYFGLAVSIFRMLFNGMHPFFAQAIPPKTGSFPAPLSIDQRVERGETPYFKKVANHTVSTYAPEVNHMPPYLTETFRRAFVDGHYDPKERPTAEDWKKALQRYRSELVDCKSHHSYWKKNKKCPYCEADNRYRQHNMPAPSLKPVPVKTTVTATRAAATVPIPLQKQFSWPFWSITLLLAVGLQYLAYPYLPDVFRFLIEDNAQWNEWVEWGPKVVVAAGVLGWFIYNKNWAKSAYTGDHHWTEYLCSVLTSVGFAAMGIIGIFVVLLAIEIFKVLLQAVVGIMIVAVIITALCSG